MCSSVGKVSGQEGEWIVRPEQSSLRQAAPGPGLAAGLGRGHERLWGSGLHPSTTAHSDGACLQN